MEPQPGVRGARARSRGDTVDVDTVAGIARGDEAAMTAAYESHSHAVFELARAVLGQRLLAEEVVQDVFVTLWNRPDRYDRDRGSLRAFLLTIAHGRAIDIARSESARRRREEREARLARSDDQRSTPAVDIATSHDVRNALEALRQDEREAIAMAYFLGYSYREVAAELGVPEGTIKNRIRKGLARLRDQLDSPVGV